MTDNARPLLVKWKDASVLYDNVVGGEIQNKWRLVRQNESSDFELYDFSTNRVQTNDIAGSNSDQLSSLSDFYDLWWDIVSVGSEDFPPLVINPRIEEESVLTLMRVGPW